MRSVSDELTAKVKQLTTDKEILYAKYQKIQDFNKLTVVFAYQIACFTHCAIYTMAPTKTVI